MQNEVWRDINMDKYRDFYEVSNLGRVRSKSLTYVTEGGSTYKRKSKLLKNVLQLSGYVTVYLTTNNKGTYVVLHRILALTFIPNEDESKNIINHKNGIKHDNSLDNLEWCNNKENCEHAYKMGLAKKGKFHYLSKKIGMFTMNGELLETFDCLPQIREKYGYNIKNIHSVIKGKRNKANNFIWKNV
jgi:hypothetical protein